MSFILIVVCNSSKLDRFMPLSLPQIRQIFASTFGPSTPRTLPAGKNLYLGRSRRRKNPGSSSLVQTGTPGTCWNGNWNGNRALRYYKRRMFQCSNIYIKKFYAVEKKKGSKGNRVYI